MQDYRVELDAFSGPMDLLLFLVKRDEIDLLDIPIARLTEQYLGYLRQLQQIDVDLAGEFLVMAATLLELKSQMLVPQAPPVEGAEGETTTDTAAALDPRRELVQALLAYKRFKDAAMMLEQRAGDWARRYPRRPVPVKVAVPSYETDTEEPTLFPGEEATAGDPVPEVDETAGLVEFDLEDANVLDLANLYARIMESIGRVVAAHQVTYDDTPIGLHADDIVDRLTREGPLTLQQVFEGRTRGERIGLFLALLELVRQRKIQVQQEDLNRPIGIELQTAATPSPSGPDASAAAPAATPQPAPADGSQYDWPDEESRRMAMRRAGLRFKWAQKKQAATDTQSDQPDTTDSTMGIDAEGFSPGSNTPSGTDDTPTAPDDVTDAELAELDARLSAEEASDPNAADEVPPQS